MDNQRDWREVAREQSQQTTEWAGRHQECLHYLSDLDAAIFLAAEYNPDMPIGDFFKGAGVVERVRAYLHANQYLARKAKEMQP